jgi:cytochrome c2
MDPKTFAALITAIAALVVALPSLLTVENARPITGRGLCARARACHNFRQGAARFGPRNRELLAHASCVMAITYKLVGLCLCT